VPALHLELHDGYRYGRIDAHSAWQWEDIVSNSRAIVMDDLPQELQPIVQYIDDWNTNRKLGLVFECRVLDGKLLVCSADLTRNIRRRPAARQLRFSVLDYMASKAFDPKVEVTIDQLRSLPCDAPWLMSV